jgi:hypothetical protein
MIERPTNLFRTASAVANESLLLYKATPLTPSLLQRYHICLAVAAVPGTLRTEFRECIILAFTCITTTKEAGPCSYQLYFLSGRSINTPITACHRGSWFAFILHMVPVFLYRSSIIHFHGSREKEKRRPRSIMSTENVSSRILVHRLGLPQKLHDIQNLCGSVFAGVFVADGMDIPMPLGCCCWLLDGSGLLLTYLSLYRITKGQRVGVYPFFGFRLLREWWC